MTVGEIVLLIALVLHALAVYFGLRHQGNKVGTVATDVQTTSNKVDELLTTIKNGGHPTKPPAKKKTARRQPKP